MSSNRLYVALVFTVLIVISANTLTAQQSDRERLAIALEQGADQRGAARIYLELLNESPDNRRYFDGVVRTLTSLSQFESLLPIAEKYAEKHPSVELEVLLGTLANKAGNEADAHWKRAIELGRSSESAFASVGRAQASLMLTTEAISTFEQARIASQDKFAYADPLSRLYTVVGNYRAAVNEILTMFTMTGDEYSTEGRLAAIMTTESGAEITGKILDSASISNPDLLRIQWWYLTQQKRWDQAFDVATKVDDLENQNGRIVLSFADAARKAQAYDIAIKAYGSLVNKDQTIAVAASYGYTQTLDQRVSTSQKFSIEEAQSIIDRYKGIVRNHPNNPLAASALLREAQLTIQYLRDTSNAIDVLTSLVNKWRGTSYSSEGALMLADLYYALGNNVASSELLTGLEEHKGALADIARLRKADHTLFNHQLTNAKQTYLELSADTHSDAANDAIDRLGLLMLLPDDSIGVVSYIDAMHLQAKGNSLAAAVAFSATAEKAKDQDLVDRAHIEAAILYQNTHDTIAVLNQLKSVLLRIPESTVGDRALQIVADLYERSGRIQEALDTLTTLLVQYPRSILAPQCRERIRRLRGDA